MQAYYPFSSKKLLPLKLFLCLALLSSTRATAQVKVEEEINTNDEQTVVLYADPRLALLTAYEESSRAAAATSSSANSKGISGSIHSAKGFRVLIYSGTDRNKANSTKSDFMRKHPGTRVYMTYVLPQYRIKVGDYATRHEATEFYRQLSSSYSPCMVVPDIVEINTFRKNDQ